MNTHGQPRLTRFYDELTFEQQQQAIKECYSLVSKRSASLCNFLEGDLIWGPDVRLIYRHYATLYFIFAVDRSESELGILDLIQVFVEALDKCFENVCELDLIFNIDRVHQILDEVVMAGMVLETSLADIVKHSVLTNKYTRKTKSETLKKTTNIGLKSK